MSKTYKDSKIYGCFILNRLVAQLGIGLYQPGLEDKLDMICPIPIGPISATVAP